MHLHSQTHACVNVHTYGCVEIMMSETIKNLQMNCLAPVGTGVKNMLCACVSVLC